MKLKELKTVLSSNRGCIQLAILFDSKTNSDIENASIDYIVENHGDKDVIRIEAFENQLIVTV